MSGEQATPASTRPTVLFVDDVEVDLRKYRRGLAQFGTYDVKVASSVYEALDIVKHVKIDAAVLDLKMPPGPLDPVETDHGEETGLVVAAKIVELQPDIKILILSNDEAGLDLDPGLKKRINVFGTMIKLDCRPIDLLRSLDRLFGISSLSPTLFIVHGHDRDLVNFVQETVESDLKWARPIVLDEQAGGGLTIIEKFEQFASRADAVVVIMSPDDVGSSKATISSNQFRARQNVLFELGYFYGKFKRQSGRVFVLKKGDLEMPSDLAGLVYLNVGEDLEAARDRLKIELKYLFEPTVNV